jgi:hypothetical protein
MKLTVIIAALVLCSCSSFQQPVERFVVNLASPQLNAGSAEAEFEQFISFGKLKKGDIAVHYYPADDALRLQYKVDFITYNQFWSKSGREVFIKALEQYKEDYEQRNLVKSNQKTKRIYGTVLGFLAWKTTRFSVQATGNPKIELGYYFKSKSPYFAITQREASYEDNFSRDNNKTSPNIVIYFTRNQAENLAALFDQEYLQGLDLGTQKTESTDMEEDEY